MATCRAIISTGLRLATVTGAADTPDSQETTDGLMALQSLYDGWASSGMFGALTDVLAAASFTADEQTRILNTASYTITLPVTVADTLLGITRPPYDRSLIEVTDTVAATFKAYLYDARKGAWVLLTGLTLDTEAPLSNRSAYGLSAVLAMRLGEEYGVTPGKATMTAAMGFLTALSNRPDTLRQPNQATYF